MTATEPFRYDVFISHSAKDKAVVRPLAERLRADGPKVWSDEWVLKLGDSIPAKMEDGLEHSRVLILCLSAQALWPDWAQLEAGTFRSRDPLNRERRITPLRLNEAPSKAPRRNSFTSTGSRRTPSRGAPRFRNEPLMKSL